VDVVCNNEVAMRSDGGRSGAYLLKVLLTLQAWVRPWRACFDGDGWGRGGKGREKNTCSEHGKRGRCDCIL